jgi:hypothetical protein
MNREQVIATLRAHERELKEAGIVRLSLFGSTARTNAAPDSDVDLLATFDESRRLSLLDVVGIELQLADLLGVRVDLSEEGTLKPRVRQTLHKCSRIVEACSGESIGRTSCKSSAVRP